MASASPHNIKQWKLPNGELIQTLKGHNSIINCLTMNEDDVLISGGDDGTLCFWDWKTGYNFDSKRTILQPGSLDPEAGIFALGFDLSGSRLISCEADKSIKIYKEDEEATEETHPIKMKSNIIKATGF
ncbi:Pleiotropic regulator 1 [Thelohanellus kitauei]|uniref:Pleiotropic regulator 1 n=1 Tax=Thelohanellus kitauei TaxID=669202 RepID=A0A0C2N2Z6_THEKT|nr:Pleiotropic regulator 1 [Thelohanellus kitauei]